MKKLQDFALAILLFAGSIHASAQPSKQSLNYNRMSHKAHFSVNDFTTKSPIEHAVITNQSGYELGSTDAKGNMAVNVPANSREFYSIYAEGYNTMNIRLDQTNLQSGSYEVYLPSVELGYARSGIETEGNTFEMDSKPEMVKVYVKQDPATYEKKSMQGNEIMFSVQVAASSKPVSESSAKEEWEGIGRVYIQKENGMYKVRIGPYETQQEAKKILLEVKAKGRKDAFIVVQQSGQYDAPMVNEIKHAEEPTPTITEEPVVNEKPVMTKAPVVNEEETNPMAIEGDFKVRVASYLHPGTFNPDGIDKLGTLESYRKGEWTIMMIGGFRTLDEARRAKNIVVSKGFTDASIVMEKDGILETIEEK